MADGCVKTSFSCTVRYKAAFTMKFFPGISLIFGQIMVIIAFYNILEPSTFCYRNFVCHTKLKQYKKRNAAFSGSEDPMFLTPEAIALRRVETTLNIYSHVSMKEQR
ncbi:hypothetical protein [Halarsenatibacter silvermanii]|uniref:hypothetical protein n=1 Tax=Halarsenatibacter silvermanii TaxID=321763 RepID=UPI00117AC04B|nr:hypothetical protein [Halarsenatibacter silvermanii]